MWLCGLWNYEGVVFDNFIILVDGSFSGFLDTGGLAINWCFGLVYLPYNYGFVVLSRVLGYLFGINFEKNPFFFYKKITFVTFNTKSIFFLKVETNAPLYAYKNGLDMDR